jgi:SPP1 gp7 family putative phage head morphogenesis protein
MLAITLNLAARLTRRKTITFANIATTRAQANDLFALYAKLIAAWVDAQYRIVAEYERTLGELQTDSSSTTGSTIDSIADEIQRLVILLTPDLRRWALRVESVQRGKWVQSVLSATDIDLSTILSAADVEETVEAVLNWNTSLIRDVSDEIRRRISNSVFAGFQRRAPAREIAKEIREATGMARARAVRIAGDQTVKLGSRLNEARQKQAGLTHFKWRHSAKRHPRIWHEARDGHVYPWKDSGIPASDMPGIPPFCGCTAQGVIVFDE